jgi:hypothetical protein
MIQEIEGLWWFCTEEEDLSSSSITELRTIVLSKYNFDILIYLN